MAYFVHVATAVEDYVMAVEELPLSRRQEVLDALVQDLEQNADHFLNTYPLGHESYTFQYEYAFIEAATIWSFRFVCGAEHLAAGVVQVKYVEYETIPIV